jgi:superfamily II DNA or RNA helicase
MKSALLADLHGYLARLAQLSPDGVSLQNGIGFSGATIGPGIKLLRSFPYWQPWDVEKGFEIARTHARQLGIDAAGLAAQWEAFRPELDAALQALADQAREIAAAEVESAKESAEPFGIVFSDWRTVETRAGLKRVRSGEPSQAFWVAWKGDKEGIKAAGFSLGKSFRDAGKWEVSQWERNAANAAPVRELIAPAPLSNPAGLLPYQVAPVSVHVAAIANFSATIDASDTGTGKTYTALAVCRELGIAPLVIAPKAVLPSWKRAASHLGVTLAGCVNYELARTGNRPEIGVWTGKGKDERFVFAAGIACVIFDEAHRCKGQDTANAYLMRAAKDQGIKTIALSATLAHNPLEMRAVGSLIGLTTWSGFWKWALRHGCSKNPWGGLDFNGSRLVLDSLHKAIFPAHGARVRVADLGDAFPETQIAAEAYNGNGMAGQIDAIDAEMHRELAELERRSSGDKAEGRAAALVAMLRARQRAEFVKVPLFVELAQDAIAESRSVAIFVCFRETLAAIVDRLEGSGIKCAQIKGEQTAEEREAGIAAFQADQIHCIAAMIQAGGVGVSLHDLHGNRARSSFISPTWSAVELRQTLGRVWRAGGKTKSVQRIVFVADSVEENVRRTVDAKLARLDTLNDGDMGKPAGIVSEADTDRSELVFHPHTDQGGQTPAQFRKELRKAYA